MQHKIEFFPSYAFSVLDDFIKDIRGIIAYDNTLWYELVAQAEKDVVEDLIKRYQNFVIEFNCFITAHPRVDSLLLSIGDGLTLCRRNDASLKAQNQTHEHDGLKFP
ncbi:hypothetical protein Golob_014821 [Gossypium lobatum]|uniref:Uncharacterized protein n=1 Tax=Gossypium lobatum TaxID=34289 RepID=A0A7J8LZ99_9ROSI|nr:hypothetical protein [Gossypium lobatum]